MYTYYKTHKKVRELLSFKNPSNSLSKEEQIRINRKAWQVGQPAELIYLCNFAFMTVYNHFNRLRAVPIFPLEFVEPRKDIANARNM